MTKRIIFDSLLLVAMVVTPWWLVTALVTIGVWWFPNFYEATVAGLLIDLVYGSNLGLPIIGLASFRLTFTTFFSLLLATSWYAKRLIAV